MREAADPEGPGRPIPKADVEDAVRAGLRLKVYAFSSGGGFGNVPDHWEDIVLAGNGTLFDLTSNAVSMYNDLMSIIDEACLPREEDQGAMIRDFARNYKYVSYKRYDYVNNQCL